VNIIAIVLSCALAFSVIAPVSAKEIRGCKLYYVVKPADTLRKIALSMGMTPAGRAAQKIAKINELENVNVVEVGKKLCIDENIVKTGAATLECYNISKNKKICMDKDSFDSAVKIKKCSKYHRVKKGESLSIIAKSIGMDPPYDSALKLAEASSIKNPNRVEIGDRVCVDQKYINGSPKEKEKGFKCFKTKNNRKFCVDAAALAALRSKNKPAPEPIPEPQEDLFAIPTPPPKAKPEPVAEPAPAPVVEEKKPEPEPQKDEAKKEEEPEVFIGIGATPFLSFSRIDAVDVSNNAKGSILSRADYGADFKIMQLWGNYFTSEIFLQAERKSYLTNSTRTFDHRGGDMLNIGFGMGFKFWNRLELKLRGFYGDEFYFNAPNTTSLQIDGTKTIKGDVALYFDIVTVTYASTGLGFGGRVIKAGYIEPVGGGTAYATKTGAGYFGTLYMRHKFKRVMFEESFTYESITKDTDLFKQVHMAAYLRGGVIVLF